MENQTEERELTHEELVARKEEMLQFYKDSVPYLQAQCEYEELLARIEDARFKRTETQIKFAMMMQGPPEEGETPADKGQDQGRKLKKN